jgi:cAMP-specific phosphodiesterase 4
LENFHVAEAFKLIVFNKDCNIFSELSEEDYKLMRKRIVECVLATDMTLHTKEHNFLKMKIENYEISKGQNLEKVFDNLDSFALFNMQQEFLNTLLHMADISNPTKGLKIYQVWVDKVMEEFWAQGDIEKDKKLPISFLCDRTTTKIPNSQIGFIDGIVMPLTKNVVEILPELSFMVDNLNENRAYYKKLKDESEQIK